MPQRLRTAVLRSAYCVVFSLITLSTACSAQPQPGPTPTLEQRSATQTSSPTETRPAPATVTATASVTPTPLPQVCSPLAVQPLQEMSAIITQPFLMPRVMPDGSYTDDAHHGVDLGYYTRDGKPFTGTPVLAALPGKIASIIQDRPPYGNMLMIETPFERIPANVITSQNLPAGSSIYTLYAHLQNMQDLKIGRAVNCGQALAETGHSGFTGGNHLHFETRWGPAGVTFASMAYYKADATVEELANYKKWRMSGTFHLFDPMKLLVP